MTGFEVAGGTILGHDHARIGKNAQDSFYWETREGVLVAVVCDGCSGGDNSEVGAKLGARIVTQQTLRWFLNDRRSFSLLGQNKGLERVARSTLVEIASIVDRMGGSFSETVGEYFLFTILGVIVDPAGSTSVFGCGDGVFYVNDVPKVLTSAGNAPDYLAYELVETARQTAPSLQVHSLDDSSKVTSLLIGTDGAADLARSFDERIPGKDEKIGSISQFWTRDTFFKNPFSVGHRLALLNRTVKTLDYDRKVVAEIHGPLRDDTTIIAIRRKVTK